MHHILTRTSALVLVLVGCTGPQADPPADEASRPDPLASKGDSQGGPGLPPSVVRVDGEAIPTTAAFVFATDNANERFYATIHTDVSVDHRTQAVEIELAPLPGESERTVISGSGGSSDPTRLSLVLDRRGAERFAAAFGIPLQERAHPGHSLTGSFEVGGTPRPSSAEVPARFTITSSGLVPIAYLEGGRYRNASGRDNRFTFQIVLDGEPQPDVGSSHDFGGLAVYRTLEPGDSRAIEVDLAHWCSFPRPGRYEIRATYELELRAPDIDPREQPFERRGHERWDDALTVEFHVEVEP